MRMDEVSEVTTVAAQTVFVIDDDERLLHNVSRLLERAGLDVQTFASGEAFLRSCPRDGAGCIVLDIRMPGIDGLELQDELRDRGVELPIVFVSGYGDVPQTARAMKAGAVDFLEKPFPGERLLDAVHAALERGRAAQAARTRRRAMQQRLKLLTPRERQVLERVVLGYTNRKIANELGTGEHTIKVHRGRMMTKMEAGSLAELVIYAQVAGIPVTQVS
jgi:two-component system response regulator FixJ